MVWHHLEEIGIRPRPLQRPIPIWLAGSAEASLRRVAAIGNGWFPLIAPDETARAAIARLREYVHAAGRDPANIGIEAAVEIVEHARLIGGARPRAGRL